MKLNRIVIDGRYLLVEIPNQVREDHEQKFAEEVIHFHVDVYSTAGKSSPGCLHIRCCHGSLRSHWDVFISGSMLMVS